MYGRVRRAASSTNTRIGTGTGRKNKSGGANGYGTPNAHALSSILSQIKWGQYRLVPIQIASYVHFHFAPAANVVTLDDLVS